MDVFTDGFRAMGTDVELTLVGGDPHLLRDARHRIEQLEHRWSRFLPTSEISRLNEAAGDSVQVSVDTLTLVERACLGSTLTAGRFDPMQLGNVEAIGYRTSFEEIDRPDVSGDPTGRVGGLPVVDHAHRLVTMPAGSGFDPGGIGKGLAADLVVDELMAAGATGVCVNLGGDVRVSGTPPHGDEWIVAVRDRPEDDAVAYVAVTEGAVATSSRSRRRWVDASGHSHHHLIDPATGESSASPVVFGTAIAACGWQAEVLSTVVVLDGDAGLDRAHALGAAAAYSTGTEMVAGVGWDQFVRSLEVAA